MMCIIFNVSLFHQVMSDMPVSIVPTVENFGLERFLPQDPWTLLNSDAINRVPIIIGFNKLETSYLYPGIFGVHLASPYSEEQI